MNRIVVTGASGQIGSELVPALRATYGADKVVATDIRLQGGEHEDGLFECLDVTDAKAVHTIVRKYKADTIIHLAALLSATAESNPLIAWTINMSGLLNTLETARELSCRLFTPSSIGAFGPGTPKYMTPQVTIQRPSTMYGINKVAGELLCDYYYLKYGVDTRSVRFPGLISYMAPPGGGTTDYAVDMYVQAVKQRRYTSYIAKGTYMDMMYMDDAVQAVIQLMEADSSRLRHRNAYNISAMSVDPETIAAEIRKHIPAFTLAYDPDPMRQRIADSWPDAIDTAAAAEEWGFQARFTLEKMTEHMLFHIGNSALQDEVNRLA